MSVAIRLARRGKKSQPHFNIIVQDKEKHPRGGFIQKLGYYKPYTNPATVELDLTTYDDWISKGAQASERVRKIADLARGGTLEIKPVKHKKFGGKFVEEVKPAPAPAEKPAEADEPAPEAPTEEISST